MTSADYESIVSHTLSFIRGMREGLSVAGEDVAAKRFADLEEFISKEVEKAEAIAEYADLLTEDGCEEECA